MRVACLVVVAVVAVSWVLHAAPAAAGEGGAALLPHGTVRLVVMSDTHLAGPEYPLNTENGPIDNDSITRTQQRMYRAIQAINAISPAPQLVLFGGDVVHNGLHYLQTLGFNATGLDRLFSEPVNGFKIAQALFSQLQAPQLFVWGNHDNLVECGQPDSSPSRQLAAQVYRRFFDAAPYSAQDLGDSWKVVALNSMYGYTWEAEHPGCNPLLSSYGSEQLQWLDAQLAEGKNTVVMMHFPPTTSVLEEAEGTAWADLATVLSAHDNVRLVLSGHFHKGFTWQGLYPAPTLTLPAVRYNLQNFHVLDLLPNGTARFLDLPKNRGGARCSDWWEYRDGGAQYVAAIQDQDPGDCGYPAAGQEADFELSPVLNESSIPSQDIFNPERPCQFVLAQQFLEACAADASEDCCSVIGSQFRLSSSAPFATCFCQPSFWQEALQYMKSQHGLNLAAVLGRCISEYDKLIVFRGGPLTWCPAEPAVTAATR